MNTLRERSDNTCPRTIDTGLARLDRVPTDNGFGLIMTPQHSRSPSPCVRISMKLNFGCPLANKQLKLTVPSLQVKSLNVRFPRNLPSGLGRKLPSGKSINKQGKNMPRAFVRCDLFQPIGPYSHAVKSGNMNFVSGTPGVDPKSGELAGPTAYAQAAQAIRNVIDCIVAAGGSEADITTVQVNLVHVDDFTEMNRAYSEHFSEHFLLEPSSALMRSPNPEPGLPSTLWQYCNPSDAPMHNIRVCPKFCVKRPLPSKLGKDRFGRAAAD